MFSIKWQKWNIGHPQQGVRFPSLCSLPPPVVTNLVDPVLCLRKAYPKYSGPAHGTFVLGSADELKRPHNLRNNLLLFNLCYFSKRLSCQDFQKTFIKGNEYNIWLIGPAFRCASSFGPEMITHSVTNFLVFSVKVNSSQPQSPKWLL